MRSKRFNRFRSRHRKPIDEPRYKEGDVIGDFTVVNHRSHSHINPRTGEQMTRIHHWYRCLCSCGTEEYRSQQELRDVRRSQCCYNCRALNDGESNADHD